MITYTNEYLHKLDKDTSIKSYIVAGDTDSCIGSTIINDCNISMEKAFEYYSNIGKIEILQNGTEIAIPKVKNRLNGISQNGKTKIVNVSRHKVSKSHWKISIDDSEVQLTGDHSIMIYRNGNIIECSAKDIKSTDYLLKKKDI